MGSGGRYDTLLARFGRPLPAVGFMLGLDRLALLLARQRRLETAPRASAEAVAATHLGAGLKDAVARRARGTRVRFGDGGPR